jgi:exonuclease III
VIGDLLSILADRCRNRLFSADDMYHRFGTLNVGSLNKMGRKEEINEMMIRRKIDILGLSETKWPGQGMKQLRKGHHIVWSGEKEEKKMGWQSY